MWDVRGAVKWEEGARRAACRTRGVGRGAMEGVMGLNRTLLFGAWHATSEWVSRGSGLFAQL